MYRRRVFLSTLSLRRATAWHSIGIDISDVISIHALLAESDMHSPILICAAAMISIHALLAESDITMTTAICTVSRFLSTLSLRRATAGHDFCARHSISISIHALLAESDSGHDLGGRVCKRFLSTLSLRRATTLIWDVIAEITISIHALLAESDSKSAQNSGALLRI